MELANIKWILATVTLLLVSNIRRRSRNRRNSSAKFLFKPNVIERCKPQFDRAVAMLHSFWFQQGEKAFREILERDPNCAIANWGIAAILIGNTIDGGATAQDAQKAKEAI